MHHRFVSVMEFLLGSCYYSHVVEFLLTLLIWILRMCYGCCSVASMNIGLGGGPVYIGTFVIYDDMHRLRVFSAMCDSNSARGASQGPF